MPPDQRAPDEGAERHPQSEQRAGAGELLIDIGAGGVAWTSSTNQASSGPESRARKAPMSAAPRTKAQNDWASAIGERR
jgi:hypothetical protein